MAAPDADEARIRAALDDLGLAERFDALPRGPRHAGRDARHQLLGRRTPTRVGRARAGSIDPSVLVLDEATSSLDPGTELLLDRALERLMAGRTVVVIAHRLTTARRRADLVAVVDEGRLVEVGTHAELVAHARGGTPRSTRRGRVASARGVDKSVSAAERAVAPLLRGKDERQGGFAHGE